MSGTEQPKALVDYPINELRKMYAALAPLYPPVILTDHRELSERRDEMQWAGGANAVVRDIATAIEAKKADKE